MNNDNRRNDDGREIIQPIMFIPDGQDWRINPIYSLDEAPNTPDRFVIVKTTQNGKYLIGNSLRYEFNGIEIITDSDNAIFVDRINKSVIIKEYDRALREINPEDPEERQYVLLFVDEQLEGDGYSWEALMGRTDTYNFIVSHVGLYNPKKSLVLTDNVALKDALTISQFVKYLHNSDIVDDDFNIEDYEGMYDD